MATLFLGALAAGCGSGGQEHDERSDEGRAAVDMRQAGDRAEGILDDTLKAIEPAVKWDYSTPIEIGCGDGSNRPTGTTTVKRSRVVTTKVSATRRGSLLGVVHRHWEKQGYRIVGVNADKDMPNLHAKTQDGFSVSLGVGDIGNVYFDVASPCAAPSGMSFPQGTPGKPGRPDPKVDLTPRYGSDFWSSDEPLR